MKPIVLVIRDGWGIRREKAGNAPKLAATPHTDLLLKRYPVATLDAAGVAVGLPSGYQGNSEVGHLTLGSGRTIYQNLMRINQAIKDKSFFSNKSLLKVMTAVKRKKSRLHLMGLVQDEGVHAHSDHLLALMKMAKDIGVEVVIHVFTDGRDTPPRSAKKYVSQIARQCGTHCAIGTVMGRYYAMDRDKRWMRTELAYRAIVHGEGITADSWQGAIADAYGQDEGDEFIRPRIIDGYAGLDKNDGLIFFNYRYDRARQLTKALVEADFMEFQQTHPTISFVAMTDYYDAMPCDVAFGPHHLTHLLGEVLARHKKKQLRISETEKYAHVTFFFNGLEEKANKNEDRILIPSPGVATYDLKPEMSVYEVTENLLFAMEHYDVVVVNLVNGDLVGHTGKIKAAVAACAAVDDCLSKITKKTLELGGMVLVTADHGNCEEMVGVHKTSHTLNPVDLIFVSKKHVKLSRKNGTLADVAPTILALLELPIPKEMTGTSFV